jgi:hypothetical protein
MAAVEGLLSFRMHAGSAQAGEVAGLGLGEVTYYNY